MSDKTQSEARRLHTESEMRRAALLDEMQKAALAAGQAVVQDVVALVRAAQALVLEPDSHKKKLELEAKAWGLLAAATQPAALNGQAPAQPAAQHGVAYAALPEPLSKRPSEANTLVWVADPISSTGVRGVFVDDITCLWWWGAGLIFQKEVDASALALRMRSAIASHGLAPAETEFPVSAQADSVQEDAALLDFLIEQRAYVVSDPDACTGYWLQWAMPDGSTLVQCDDHPTPRAAIDAARKQGAGWQSAMRALTLHI